MSPSAGHRKSPAQIFFSGCFIALVAATAAALLALRGVPAGAVLRWEQQ